MPMPTSPAYCAWSLSKRSWKRNAHASPRLGEFAQVGAGSLGPAAAADDRDRPLRLRKYREQPLDGIACRRRGHALPGRCGGRLRFLGEHVFRQRQDDGPLPPGRRRVERATHVFGDTPRIVDLRRPLRRLAEHAAVVDLLEGLAVGEPPRDLADEEDQRSRILKGRVDTDRRVRRAGPARDEGDARPPDELAVRIRHVRRAALVSARDQLHAIAHVVEFVFVQRRTDTDVVDALLHQALDEDLTAAASQCRASTHRTDLPVTSSRRGLRPRSARRRSD